MEYREIERITLGLMSQHGCHTAILYGSWSRGQGTANSDLDLLLVRESGPQVRDARIIDGVYVDGFVYPESALTSPDASFLRVLGGKVIRERASCGTEFLAKVQALHDQGPTPLAADEREAVLLWSAKMVDRFRGQAGLMPNYRRMQLLLQSLEDYFAFRGAWFRGPKEAFIWLEQNDPETHTCFARASEPGAGDEAFDDLVRVVYTQAPKHAKTKV